MWNPILKSTPTTQLFSPNYIIPHRFSAPKDDPKGLITPYAEIRQLEPPSSCSVPMQSMPLQQANHHQHHHHGSPSPSSASTQAGSGVRALRSLSQEGWLNYDFLNPNSKTSSNGSSNNVGDTSPAAATAAAAAATQDEEYDNLNPSSSSTSSSFLASPASQRAGNYGRSRSYTQVESTAKTSGPAPQLTRQEHQKIKKRLMFPLRSSRSPSKSPQHSATTTATTTTTSTTTTSPRPSPSPSAHQKHAGGRHEVVMAVVDDTDTYVYMAPVLGGGDFPEGMAAPVVPATAAALRAKKEAAGGTNGGDMELELGSDGEGR